ncbi:MAG: SH3 domain-containing protein, partial [Deltaproteobacteria bacterium]|nr:SH3 domain-containing protein [Deltaproteobacteria bacterium]
MRIVEQSSDGRWSRIIYDAQPPIDPAASNESAWWVETSGIFTVTPEGSPYVVLPVVGLRIRQAPGTNGEILGVLPAGTQVQAVDITQDGKWFQIRPIPTDQLMRFDPDAPANAAWWVSADYIEPQTSDIRLQTAEEGEPYIVLPARLRVRQGAGTDESIIGELSAGTVIDVVGSTTIEEGEAQEIWYQINPISTDQLSRFNKNTPVNAQ